MANVKGVILNGTKYELLDSEARQLAGDAINQVETLENTVAAVETDVTAIKADLVTVAETATEAKSTATEASTLATQAETRAQEAYELAEKAGKATNFLTYVKTISEESAINLTSADINDLFGSAIANIATGKRFLMRFYIKRLDGTLETNVVVLQKQVSGFRNAAQIGDTIFISAGQSTITITNTVSQTITVLIDTSKQL